MITEDDYDTHICLKCHTTIHGLDSYVAHRKTDCRAQNSEHIKSEPLGSLIPPDEPDFALKADVFFSLLELQSSSKKSSIQVPQSGKTNSGVLTRSKATAVIQASNPNRASDWIGGHQLRELGNEDNQTKLINAVDNISGHHIKKQEPIRITYEEELDDDLKKEEPSIRTVYEEELDDTISDNHIKKQEPMRTNYEEELDEDSNYEYDEEDDEDFEEIDSRHAPPRLHTGGKWKPTSSPIQWLSANSNEDQCDWRNPPSSHTGGKWKPESYGEDEYDKNAPPADHTQGKWIPGRSDESTQTEQQTNSLLPEKSAGGIKYWCGPCNRHLASKIVYERHLKTILHFRRSMEERAFENATEYQNQEENLHKRGAEGAREIIKPTQDSKKWEEKVVTSNKYTKCDVCRSKVLKHLMGKHLISHYHCRKRNIPKSVAHQMILDNIYSIVQQAPFQCSVCRFFCNRQSDFLHHWRSFDHIITTQNTNGIFICSFCKFHCKHNHLMIEHLESASHAEVISVVNKSVPIVINMIRPIVCTECKKEFRFNSALRRHCMRENHILAESATNKYQAKFYCSECSKVLRTHKSLQRHLKRKHGKDYFFCSICALTFYTYLESKQHRSTPSHIYAVLGRNYERGLTSKNISRVCEHCYLRFANVLKLKEHLRKEHPTNFFSCSKCGKRFVLSQEVSRHVRSNSCTYDYGNYPWYFGCLKCAFKANSEADFLFHVTLHTEPVSVFSDQDTGTSSKQQPTLKYRCPVCDVLFPKTSLRCHVRKHTNEKPYKCQICKIAYSRKSNLVYHMQNTHKDVHRNNATVTAKEVNKDTFQCTECQEMFSQKNQLDYHLLLSHSFIDDGKEKDSPTEEERKEFLCSYCGKSFLRRYTFVQHTLVHTGKKFQCPHEGCIYRTRTAAELKPHLAMAHSDLIPIECDLCNFRTKTNVQLNRHVKSMHSDQKIKKAKKEFPCSYCNFKASVRWQLNRHLRSHTKSKIFVCPHCSYSCSILENLRKHVISTNKHQGKFLYECQFCEEPSTYSTNFSKEFCKHLITTHPERFENAKLAQTYIGGLYIANEDRKIYHNKNTTEPIISTTKNIRNYSRKPKQDKQKYPSSSSKPSHTSTASTTVLLLSLVDDDASPKTATSDLLSMPVLPKSKTDIIYVETPSTESETWTMEGFYDVEESGTLVPFQTQNENIFVEHFNSESSS